MATVRFEAKLAGYVHPEMVVSTGWVAAHLQDPAVRMVEVDEDNALYEAGHIQGAVALDWRKELQDPIRRDVVSREGFEALMSRKGIAPRTTVVLYGDQCNWVATAALWLLKLYGHEDVRIMDGGRLRWETEGRPWTRDPATHPPTSYTAGEPDLSIRAYRDEVFRQMEAGQPLVDVRSPAEYRGAWHSLTDDRQGGAEQAGHIPGARNIPWETAVNLSDGTFKGADELRAIYQGTYGILPEQEVICYGRVGARSSHTWFVLTYLLGYPCVKAYDGSWIEWGNLVGAPIER
jgi:thiosulfate/3-mercaptopyruvate sulfurtransferase